MSTLPLIFRGDRIRALVVGGGTIARHKVEKLLATGARVTVIAPEIDPALERMIAATRAARWLNRVYCAGDSRMPSHRNPSHRAFNLMVAATDDPATNRAISDEAMAEGIPVNVVDVPELCTVYFAAEVREGPLLVAISSGGEAPFLAKRLKTEVGELVHRWAPRAEWAAIFRRWVKEHVASMDHRNAMYERFLDLGDADLAAWDPDRPPIDLWASWRDSL